jgi:hypothetical protein
MRDRGDSQDEHEIILDTNILDQFALAGRRPYEIVLEKDFVFIKYIKGNWRYTTVAIWEKDFSPNGDPMRTLKITYGTYGWRILSQRGEPGVQANGNQPVHQETNQTPETAASRLSP